MAHFTTQHLSGLSHSQVSDENMSYLSKEQHTAPGKRPGLSQGQESSKKNRAAFQDLSNAGSQATVQDDFMVFQEQGCGGANNQASSFASTVSYHPSIDDRQRSHQHSSSSRPAATSLALHEHSIVDVDATSQDNPLACPEYAVAIFNYLHEAECSRRPNPHYMTALQTDVTAHMRSVLVDWLVEVAQEYKLCSDTLFQAIALLDRYLSVEHVPREKLQLAGVACMWIAAKYEEIYAPTSRDFCYITDNTYSRSDLVATEARVLAALRYEVTAPTSKTFLRRYLQAALADEQAHYLASYLCELTLMDATMMGVLPSLVAAACVALARQLLGLTPWTPTLQHYSGYTASELEVTVTALARLHAAACAPDCQYTSVRDKYAANSMHGVSAVAAGTQ